MAQGEKGGEKNLVAYVVPDPSDTTDSKMKRREMLCSLKSQLPFYMVPAQIIFLNRSVCTCTYYQQQYGTLVNLI